MKKCRICNQNKALEDFYEDHKYKDFHRGECKACFIQIQSERQKNNPERYKEYQQKYRSQNRHTTRYKSYLTQDLKKNLTSNIDEGKTELLMNQSCHYCTTHPAGGLDRKDSTKAHTNKNCVSCCPKCNIILGDIPYPAKLELAEGLEKIYKQDLLRNWVPPIYRRNHV